MNYKIEGALKRNRKRFIIFGILWLVLIIVFVSPLACTIIDAKAGGAFSFELFLESIGKNIINPFASIGKAFGKGYIGAFGSGVLYFSIFYIILVIIGLIRSAPKNQYSDIEHGSSDWSEHGEQYRVLNKKEGIILAEDNYLPLHKMGNINVLIVGRIWIW